MEHNKERLYTFLNYIIAIEPTISFTFEIEQNNLTFLDILIYITGNTFKIMVHIKM